MARDSAIEFTENRYASRKEMSNELGIVVPNEMWSKVLAYRANFMSQLSLLDISDRPINVCLYPTLASKCNQVEAKLLRFLNNSEKLDTMSGNKQHFRVTLLADVLESISAVKGISLEKPRLKKLVISENPFDEDEEKVLNYLDALSYIEEKYVNNVDIDFLADLYSKVSGVDELTYFYRNSDFSDLESLVLVNRVQRSAPHEKIEKMMDNLFSFIASSDIGVLNKALITYYYVSYVRPFIDYNDEIACLLAKSVLAHYSLGEQAVLLPIEKILLEKVNVSNKIYQEVQSSTDITYFLSPIISKFDKDLEETMNTLREYSLNEVRNDFYQIDEEPVKEEKKVEEKQKVEEVIVDENNLLGLEFSNEEKEEAPVKEEIKEPVKEEVIEQKVEIKEEPVVEEIKIIEEEKPVVIKQKEEVKQKPIEVKQEIEEVPQGLAISYLPNELDEKEAKRLEENLLELDVRLKKGEARFYARHCTLGRYYTIEQYKKLNRCVYETARTSMDHLVELGYYSKAKVGKKFVYTPIKR